MEAMNHYNHLPLNIAVTTHRQVVPITLFVAVLCLCLVIGHLLDENRWVNESITAIIIGCIVGTIILIVSKWKSSRLLRFDEELFFIYLLPPIIFNAGFQVKKKQFFHNFFPIMLFGVAGVFISTSIVAAGVVNDATSVVLFNAVRKLNANTFRGKAVLHILLDFLHSSVREISLMILVAYLSYILAELFELSGILTVFFAGVLMSHYAWHNFTLSGVTLDPTNATMITTTIVFGLLTKPLISYLLPNNVTMCGVPRRTTSPKEEMTLPLLSFEESASENLSRAKENISMLMERPVYTIHSYWRRFDDTYMRPIFGGARSNDSSS
ncbi:Cation/H+ exchanger [Cynara cardunculus var. scolymus]|uniref:Cation/H+ exchanger n=1 Tax=Cynara cardunculus var. scolymus TaxID=59895 RepID=A0A103YJX0_CYNCS|nr:Cation/H+ exchanger [Cynara cardunculus var. scolymus]